MNFFSLAPTELDEKLVALGLPRFRGKQLRDWVYGKLVTDLTKMSNLSARDRELIAQHFDFEPGTVVRRQASEDGTFKLTTYEKDDGAPEGEYGVTVDWRAKGKTGGISLTEGGGGGAPKLNAKFSTPQQPFTKVTVKKGADNQFTFEVD